MINNGSSDSGLKNENAFCVYIFDVKRSKQVECKFFDMCIASGGGFSNVETLFKPNQQRFKKDGIDWDYVASFGLENIDTSI